MQYLFYFFLAIFSFSVNILFGQQGVFTAGGDYTGAQGSIAFTVGQTFQNSYEQGAFQEGIQQPFEIFPITSIKSRLTPIDLQIYPNPTHDWVLLRKEDTAPHTLNLALMDLDARVLQNHTWEGQEMKLDFSNLPSGTFLIILEKQGQLIGSYKIIKN
jgi:hypothetical protein